VIRRQVGSHVVLTHPERGRQVSVPVHAGRTLSRGILHGILKQTGLTVDELIRLLK